MAKDPDYIEKLDYIYVYGRETSNWCFDEYWESVTISIEERPKITKISNALDAFYNKRFTASHPLSSYKLDTPRNRFLYYSDWEERLRQSRIAAGDLDCKKGLEKYVVDDIYASMGDSWKEVVPNELVWKIEIGLENYRLGNFGPGWFVIGETTFWKEWEND
jgi:hypothetical protein